MRRCFIPVFCTAIFSSSNLFFLIFKKTTMKVFTSEVFPTWNLIMLQRVQDNTQSILYSENFLLLLLKSQHYNIFFLLLNFVYILQSVPMSSLCVFVCLSQEFLDKLRYLKLRSFLRKLSQFLLILRISSAQQGSLFQRARFPLACCCHLPQVRPAPVNQVLLFLLENKLHHLSCLKQN